MEYITDKASFLDYIEKHCHCVNAGQSKELRRFKYKLARHFGCNSYQAIALRDWRLTNFAKRFGYKTWKSLINNLTLGGENVSNKQ